MNTLLTNIKTSINKLGSSNINKEIDLVDTLMKDLSLYRQELTVSLNNQDNSTFKNTTGLGFALEKVSDEMFLYKPITVKNYFDNDYLEKFSEIRTSDLNYSGVLDIHNKFWSAHEIISGNIFATIPLELISSSQSSTLQNLHWDPIKADIYEVKPAMDLSKISLINSIEKMFKNYILIREVSGNILMVLDFQV